MRKLGGWRKQRSEQSLGAMTGEDRTLLWLENRGDDGALIKPEIMTGALHILQNMQNRLEGFNCAPWITREHYRHIVTDHSQYFKINLGKMESKESLQRKRK